MTSPANDRTNTLILASVAALTAAVAAVWAGAALACLLTGQPRPGGLAASAGALTRLPAHLGDPGRAWTPTLAVHPGAFWVGQAAVILLVGAVCGSHGPDYAMPASDARPSA